MIAEPTDTDLERGRELPKEEPFECSLLCLYRTGKSPATAHQILLEIHVDAIERKRPRSIGGLEIEHRPALQVREDVARVRIHFSGRKVSDRCRAGHVRQEQVRRNRES